MNFASSWEFELSFFTTQKAYSKSILIIIPSPVWKKEESSRDFVDLYLIIKSKSLTLKELVKLARLKFDWFVDPLHLASRLLMAKDALDLPKMLIPLEPKDWQNFFTLEAKKLKSSILVAD